MSEKTFTVTTWVPATSANLGPGFDSLGLALAYGDEYTASVVPGKGVTVEVIGVGAGEVPTDETNLLAKSLLHVYQRLNIAPPGLHLVAHNRIPHGRGMGSSGAAIVGGVTLATALLKRNNITVTSQQQLEFATELEGHPDNVAPGIFGGLTIAWMTAGKPGVKQLPVCGDVLPLVLVPDFQVATKTARALQPATVPHADAAFNAARAALLIAALTADPQLLFEATADKLHQDYRGPAMPETHKLVTALRQAGFAAVVSGAGPSVLVFCAGEPQRQQAAAFAAEYAPNWKQQMLEVSAKGATVEEV